MSKKPRDLKWVGGDSHSSVWYALGKLIMPAEHRRIEAVVRSRRERAEARAAAAAADTTAEDVVPSVKSLNAAEQEDEDRGTGSESDQNAPATGNPGETCEAQEEVQPPLVQCSEQENAPNETSEENSSAQVDRVLESPVPAVPPSAPQERSSPQAPCIAAPILSSRRTSASCNPIPSVRGTESDPEQTSAPPLPTTNPSTLPNHENPLSPQILQEIPGTWGLLRTEQPTLVEPSPLTYQGQQSQQTSLGDRLWHDQNYAYYPSHCLTANQHLWTAPPPFGACWSAPPQQLIWHQSQFLSAAQTAGFSHLG